LTKAFKFITDGYMKIGKVEDPMLQSGLHILYKSFCRESSEVLAAPRGSFYVYIEDFRFKFGMVFVSSER
jgi:hypothetical protein